MDHNGECLLPKEECKALYQRVLRAVDGELSAKEEQDVLNTIKAYPCCFNKMNLERSYKEFICSRIERKTVPIALVSSIKTKVQQMAAQLNG